MTNVAPDDPDKILSDLGNYLVSAAGGYLRNTIRENGITCKVCVTPVSPGYTFCIPCQNHTYSPEGKPADRVGILTYAINSTQSHYTMRQYKAAQPIQEHRNVVMLMATLGLHHHMSCLNKISSRPVSHWSSVPSLPAKPGEHPLHAIVQPVLQHFPEIPLLAAPTKLVTDARAFQPNHFVPLVKPPPESHVLVIEDTWVKGGHPQSAAAAIRNGGASEVSILTLARFLNPGFGNNATFIQQRLTQDYNPRICPWSGSQCP